MVSHNSTIFKNLCVKVPRKSGSSKYLPMYETKIINELENETRKLSLESEKYIPNEDNDTMKSFIKFYDSIPDYGDVNHLSNKEFYRSLENLRQKHSALYNHISSDSKCKKSSNYRDDYQNTDRNQIKSSMKPFCTTPNKSSRADNKTNVNSDSYSYEDSKDFNQPPSRRSVRIESPKFSEFGEDSPDIHYFRSKSRASKSIGSCTDSILDDLTPEDLKILNPDRDFDTLTTRSIPNTALKIKPNVEWKDGGITIPKPFQMTMRDEENKIVDEIMLKTFRHPQEEKNIGFRANPIPITSQIQLYDKILVNNETRSKRTKNKRKATLQAQMRPFSFTRREEEIEEMTKHLPNSLPISFINDVSSKVKKFKAKPVPKNLFSNYIYKKMYEDEFYRNLQKKVRAEEMLKASALPPSMARRDKISKTFGEIYRNPIKDMLANNMSLNKRNVIKSRQALLLKEFEKLQLSNIGRSPYEMSNKKQRTKSSTRSNSTQPTSIVTADSLNRSNLASVLRIRSARRRMEEEISQNLESSRFREETRWRERVLRQRPGWKALVYSHEEDMEMRLQLRRDEERMRSEEHRLSMQIMFGRVNQQPFLFERTNTPKFYKSDDKFQVDFVTPSQNDENGTTLEKPACEISDDLEISGDSSRVCDLLTPPCTILYENPRETQRKLEGAHDTEELRINQTKNEIG